MKKLILMFSFLALTTFFNYASAQTHYYYATVVNNTSCNVVVTFMDGGYNVLYSASFAPGTTNAGCRVGPCSWISSSAIGSCSITVPCTPDAYHSDYVTNCGACCTPVCIPFNTTDLPSADYSTTNYPMGACNGVSGDITDEFKIVLY